MARSAPAMGLAWIDDRFPRREVDAVQPRVEDAWPTAATPCVLLYSAEPVLFLSDSHSAGTGRVRD
jgi:hypothetical protein